jgi:hypothetical protein
MLVETKLGPLMGAVKKKKKGEEEALTANVFMSAKVSSTNRANRNNCRET